MFRTDVAGKIAEEMALRVAESEELLLRSAKLLAQPVHRLPGLATDLDPRADDAAPRAEGD